MKEQIQLRSANANDVSFIFNSWLKSFRSSNFAKPIVNEIYFNEHHKIIEKLVQENKVIVACNTDDPTQLYGYIVAGEIQGFFALHYIYVKHSFRNLGIGKSLLNYFEHDPTSAAVYTHHTRIADKLAPKYNLIYHPYLLSNKSSEESENE